MRNSILLIAVTFLVSAFIISCDDDSVKASGKKKKKVSGDEEQTLGLKFETKEKLASIPLALTPFGGDELPDEVDLSTDMPEVGNQGDQQSCVAWALAYALKSYQEKRELGEQIRFSPSYIYNQINGGENVPTYVTDGLEVLAKQGVCLYEEMPYTADEWTAKPTVDAKKSARRFRIDYWKQVQMEDIREVKAHLVAGYPIVIGAMVTQEFIQDGYEKKEKYVWKKNGKPAGGHAMVIVGYSDDKKAFKLMNSWGKEWGDDGYGWVDYDLFPEVIKYGFIAKDGYTDQSAVEKDTDPQTVYDEYEYKDEFDHEDSYNEVTEKLDFNKKNVTYNVDIPGQESRGPAMKIEGTLDIPPGFGKKFQIVVHVYDAATNKQVRSLIYPDYSDINNYAAGYTPTYDVGENGFRRGTWWLHIPYSAIDIKAGVQKDLYAIPTLFIDNFGVAVGDRIDFWLRK